jgi:Arc/MetJ family transcription regulator
MRRLAKILVAGTMLAAPLLPPLVATATSQTVPAQSQVLNTQIQLNDVLATATLNVVDTSADSTATALASGNTVTASTGQGGLDFQSSQILSGDVQALSTINAAANSGATTAQATYAVGNSGEAGSYGGDRVVGTIDQTADAVTILATGRYEGANARTGALSTAVTAVANSQGVITDNGSAGLTIVQTSRALTQADGGAVLQ